MKLRPNYVPLTWAYLKDHTEAQAYERFKATCESWLKGELLRTLFKLALDGTRPTAENVMELFVLSGKHNGKALSARPNDLLLSLLVATGIPYEISIEYRWNVHKPYWHFG